MIEHSSDNVVSFETYRKTNETAVVEKSLMVTISLWHVTNSQSPIDIAIHATDADKQYDFAALFDCDDAKPRLLALADGLDRLAGELRNVHKGLRQAK